MINYIRTLVSGNKKRFIDRTFDLDLSYITPRILAMAFPGTGLETLYRNNIYEVEKFLKMRHGSDFLIINLSGKEFGSKDFEGKLVEYEWVDHQAPPLHLLFLICEKIFNFLKENNKNVVVINCRAGKGRTGTVVCCFLLFTGRFSCPDEAFLYYSKMRFNKGEGVTQPSQKKYVHYFYKILKQRFYFPYIRSIESITLRNVTKTENSSIKPYFEFFLHNSNVMTYSTKLSYLQQKRIQIENDCVVITENSFSFIFAGDITIKLYNNRLASNEKLGRVSFNTAFLDRNQTEIKFHLNEIDPDNLAKSKKIPKDYQVIVSLGRICQCNNREIPNKLCNNCNDFFKSNQAETKNWQEIEKIFSIYSDFIDSENLRNEQRLLLFGKEYNDNIDLTLGEEINKRKLVLEGNYLRKISSSNDLELDMEESEYDDDDSNGEDDNFSRSIGQYEDLYEENSKKSGDKDSKSDLNSSFENECNIF